MSTPRLASLVIVGALGVAACSGTSATGDAPGGDTGGARRPEAEWRRVLDPARFHVLRNNARPSALVECGFLSSPYEARKIRSGGYRQRLADAIVRGIIRSSR